jgi:hypothetical protein
VGARRKLQYVTEINSMSAHPSLKGWRLVFESRQKLFGVPFKVVPRNHWDGPDIGGTKPLWQRSGLHWRSGQIDAQAGTERAVVATDLEQQISAISRRAGFCTIVTFPTTFSGAGAIADADGQQAGHPGPNHRSCKRLQMQRIATSISMMRVFRLRPTQRSSLPKRRSKTIRHFGGGSALPAVC